jgi:TolA-binding protein
MADETQQDADAPADEASPQALSGGRLARLLFWARGSKLRMTLVGGLLALVCGTTFAVWSYLARLAVNEGEEYTFARALAALEEKNYDQAKSIIGEMQHQGMASDEFGGALYILGSVKAAMADLEWSQARQRAMHLVAARYLQKADQLTIPERLEDHTKFMIGQSLVRGNQPQAGIEALTGLLGVEGQPQTTIHQLLAEAYLLLADPDLQAALQHNEEVLRDTTLDEPAQRKAAIIQADILGQLGQIEEARKYLTLTDATPAQQAQIKNITGRLAIAQAEQLPQGSTERATLAEQAREDFNESQVLDPLNSELARQALYWKGKSYEITGEPRAAIQLYEQLSKSYGDTPESMTAILAKADLARQAGETAQALAGYRTMLEMIRDPLTYVNPLLSSSALRKRLLSAYNDYVDSENFSTAMALVDALQPLFNLAEVTELRAQVHDKWAKKITNQSFQASHNKVEKLLSKARYHRRAAGAAYEQLSKLRYANLQYTEDLWKSAENYFYGQSYTHTIRMLHDYLHHQALARQALALLRLGQSQLALGQIQDSIDSLSECIEQYPNDAVVYQARLECSRAYLKLGQGDQAQALLQTNLVGEGLAPTAPEWRDSLFLLGNYLHDSEQYVAAISKLDEAVSRYPDAPQALTARYNIARSFHLASKAPAELAQEAKTESERQKNRKIRDENLGHALENYLQVQRMLTLRGHVDSNEYERMLLRNCYMMQGSVLFQLKRYEEARKAYANISTLYQNEPFVLESFVHIANCYRRMNKPMKAKGTIEQAKLILNRMPKDVNFELSTNFSRQTWKLHLQDMSEW